MGGTLVFWLFPALVSSAGGISVSPLFLGAFSFPALSLALQLSQALLVLFFGLF